LTLAKAESMLADSAVMSAHGESGNLSRAKNSVANLPVAMALK
jgi:hypothetical protein